ncbi:uncharacterized protein LOC141866240 [Acropora palmata]|uniref:uncharacterized protein LOC141866240 n=1 Tax=Acropora palmata TaxID=6131 RepID=UPI003DA0B3D6
MIFCGACEMKVQEGGNITAITVGPEWNHFRMRLVTVFETISPPKTSSSEICHGHLKTADNDDRIIGNKYYSSARKVSSREDFIAWVIPVSFPSQLRAELHRFPGLLSLLLPATTFPKRSKGSTNRYPRLG